MKHTFRRMTALLLVLLMTASLLASCFLKEESYAQTKRLFELPKGHTLLDIAKTDEGYLLLSRDENLLTVITPLDMEFKICGESTETATPNAVSFAPDGDGFYFFARTSGQGSDASYDLYKNETLFLPLGVNEAPDGLASPFVIPHSNLEVHHDTLYGAIFYGMSTGNLLVIDDQAVEMPPHGDVGEWHRVTGFMELDGNLHFMTSVDNYVYRDQTESLTQIESSYSRLFPVSDKTESLLAEGKKIDTASSSCASSEIYGYFLSGTTLYRTNGKKIVSLCDIAADGFTGGIPIRRMLVTEGEKILLLTEEGLFEYAPTEKEEATKSGSDKTTLQLAVCNVFAPETVEKAVADFNQSGTDYTVTMKVYDDVSNLNKAILSGEVDLLLSPDRILFQNYIHQGLLRDLEELCPELFREGVLLQNIVDATRVDGVSYYLPRGFTVQYCTAAKSLVGDAPTFENFTDFVAFVGEKDPAFFKTQLQSIWFQHAMSSASEWINAEDNTAHFTDESFLAFLRSCDLCAKNEDELNANFSQTPQIAMYSAGEGLSSSFYSDNPMDLVGDPQTIFTLPSALYDGYGARTPYFLGAIVGKNNQNGAKTFVEFFLTQTLITDFGMTTFITIRQDEYDAIRNGTYIDTFLPDFIPGESLYMPPNWDPITDEKSNTLITGVDHFLDGYYGDVQNIMLEEAGRYFVGDITAEQAAEYVQNRVSIYLAEQS